MASLVSVGGGKYVMKNQSEEERKVSIAKGEAAFYAGWQRDVEFIEKEKAGWETFQFDQLLKGAARGGHEDLCKLAKKEGAVEFSGMAKFAAMGDHMNLIDLAFEWTKEMHDEWRKDPNFDPAVLECDPIGATYDDVLSGGAVAGLEHMCRYAKDKGSVYFDGMLWDALEGGHFALYTLAFEWGATDFYDCFGWAAKGGTVDACVFVKDVLKQTNFDSMKAAAVTSGHPFLVALADKWLAEV